VPYPRPGRTGPPQDCGERPDVQGGDVQIAAGRLAGTSPLEGGQPEEGSGLDREAPVRVLCVLVKSPTILTTGEVVVTCSPQTGPSNMGLRVAACGEEESCGGAGSARSRLSRS
jgi:hypothetical protein